MSARGVIAAGNAFTADAGAEILADGGNAFDALVAALIASFASEPVLTSPGGGGFLLAVPADQKPKIVDFFVQTPGRKGREADLDFHRAEANFGTATQDFHIGLGSIAVPGMIAGLFDIQETYGSMPMARISEPGIRLAREGHALDPLQAEIMEVVKPIMLATLPAREVFESRIEKGSGIQADEHHQVPALADFLDALAREGPDLFYKGEVARSIADLVGDQGLLSETDLITFEVLHRSPLEMSVGGRKVLTNPLPSAGGRLVAFGLKLISQMGASSFSPESAEWLLALAGVMEATSQVRLRQDLQLADTSGDGILSKDVLDEYFSALANRATKIGGTTHISVSDAKGNVASATVSNGEGCGYMVPGTGFMLNNMLGEEDLNPNGFFNWEGNTRISSMMAPLVVSWPDGRTVAMGSGGSNRIRTALLQAASHLIFFDASLRRAVDHPRIHWEDGLLNLENGISQDVVDLVTTKYPNHTFWPDSGFFFGGVHMAQTGTGELAGAADLRRGGVVRVV